MYIIFLLLRYIVRVIFKQSNIKLYYNIIYFEIGLKIILKNENKNIEKNEVCKKVFFIAFNLYI